MPLGGEQRARALADIESGKYELKTGGVIAKEDAPMVGDDVPEYVIPDLAIEEGDVT